jgi:hypothetical protein
MKKKKTTTKKRSTKMGYMVDDWFSASDVSVLHACNQNLCGVWVRIKEIFGADHVSVVSSGHSGFLHHQNWENKILISLISLSSEGGLRSRDEESGQNKCEI